jgi:N-acetylglucosamine-6-phosphate deacetylase
MNSYILSNAKIVTPQSVVHDRFLVVEKGIITALTGDVRGYNHLPMLDTEGKYICPGFMEIHIHGCGDIGLERPSQNTLADMAGFLEGRGITGFVPTIQCDETTLSRLAEELDRDTDLQKIIPGIYIEGPFVSMLKRGGILPGFIRNPDVEYLKKLIDLSRGRLAMMTVAPELEGSHAIIEYLLDHSIVPCLGHSNGQLHHLPLFRPGANYNITHLFNGMSPISHKETGLAMLPFINREIFYELNADCIHVNRDILMMCYLSLSHEKLILISDAVVSAGLEYGKYSYYSKPVKSGEQGVRYSHNDVLIGSNCLMPDVVKKFMDHTGAPINTAIRCATLNPYTLLGKGATKGSIEPGKQADLIVLDDDLRFIRRI